MLPKPQIRSCTIEELYTVPTPSPTTSIKAVQSTPAPTLKSVSLTPQLNSSGLSANSPATTSILAVPNKSFVQKNALVLSIAFIAAIGVSIYLYKKSNDKKKERS